MDCTLGKDDHGNDAYIVQTSFYSTGTESIQFDRPIKYESNFTGVANEK